MWMFYLSKAWGIPFGEHSLHLDGAQPQHLQILHTTSHLKSSSLSSHHLTSSSTIVPDLLNYSPSKSATKSTSMSSKPTQRRLTPQPSEQLSFTLENPVPSPTHHPLSNALTAFESNIPFLEILKQIYNERKEFLFKQKLFSLEALD